MDEDVPEERFGHPPAVALAPVSPAAEQFTVKGYGPRGGVGESDLGLVHRLQQAGEVMLLPVVIAVEKGQVPAPGCRDPGIAGDSRSRVVHPDHLAVAGGFEGGRGAIRAAIVNDQDFQVAEVLAQHRIDRPEDKPPAVARRDDHADYRVWHAAT